MTSFNGGPISQGFEDWWDRVGWRKLDIYYVYKMMGVGGEVLYVGMTMESIRRRMNAHYRQYPWVQEEVVGIEIDSEWPSREEAAQREELLIQSEKPHYNQKHTGRGYRYARVKGYTGHIPE